MKIYLILCVLTFNGCISAYENGYKVFSSSSNLKGLYYHSPNGTELRADIVDNSSIHKEIGTEITKGILGLGTATSEGTIFLK